jgi:hypothetical protein
MVATYYISSYRRKKECCSIRQQFSRHGIDRYFFQRNPLRLWMHLAVRNILENGEPTAKRSPLLRLRGTEEHYPFGPNGASEVTNPGIVPQISLNSL